MTEQNEIITPVFKNKPSNLQKHSFTARPAVKINSSILRLSSVRRFLCMTEQNEIITPVFKNKPSNLQKHSFTARPAVKINVNEVELTIFKGTNSMKLLPQFSKTSQVIYKSILLRHALP